MEKELMQSLAFKLNHWDDDHEYIVACYGSEKGHQIVEVTCKQLIAPVYAALRLLEKIYSNNDKWTDEQPSIIQEHLQTVWQALWAEEVWKIDKEE